MTRNRRYCPKFWRCSKMCVFVIGSICFLGIYLFFIPVIFNYFAVLAKMKASFASEFNDTQPFRFIINERDKCKDGAPFLILLIATKADEMLHREAIRKTWGNESVVPNVKVVRLFMLGANDKDQNEALLWESRKHHDIIQQDFLDAYKNLTLKTMMGLKWIINYCGGASFVMKTDTDVFVNTEYLIQKLLKPLVPLSQYFFTGFLMRNARPHRNIASKWYVPKDIYPAESYPDFCSGTGYVFSGSLVPKIVNASSKVKFLYLEDVYVALCLDQEGIKMVPPPENYLFNIHKVSFSPCTYDRLITSHGINPNEQIIYWETLQKEKHECGK
uniref:Hexosyltransferase n=1 Tax=Pelusios castaneus TaxID=367368 RepID=A0A8C8S090_9SAUR